tara:strand:- start:32 stop:718 length:687 start_codon:yes stop_codon:yes gene_type:complete
MERGFLDDNLSKVIGRNIRKRIKDQGLTAHSLGYRIGVSGNTIGRVINGTSKSLQWTTVEAIAKALHTDVSQFFFEAGNSKEYTGIQSIDERVSLISHNLFNGIEGYKLISKFFCDEYRLMYADGSWNDSAKIGPTLQEESVANAEFNIVSVEIHSVSIVNDLICIHETTSEIIDADHLGIPNPKDKQCRRLNTLDFWTPDVPTQKIARGKDWKIQSRSVKVLSIEIE